MVLDVMSVTTIHSDMEMVYEKPFALIYIVRMIYFILNITVFCKIQLCVCSVTLLTVPNISSLFATCIMSTVPKQPA